MLSSEMKKAMSSQRELLYYRLLSPSLYDLSLNFFFFFFFCCCCCLKEEKREEMATTSHDSHQSTSEGVNGSQQGAPQQDFRHPWDLETFRTNAHRMVDLVIDYHSSLPQRPVLATVEQGYLQRTASSETPEQGEPFEALISDLNEKILPGITHVRYLTSMSTEVLYSSD